MNPSHPNVYAVNSAIQDVQRELVRLQAKLDQLESRDSDRREVILQLRIQIAILERIVNESTTKLKTAEWRLTMMWALIWGVIGLLIGYLVVP